MKRIALKSAVACAVVLASYSCDEVVDAITENGETANGLKSALSVGIDTAASRLSKKGGYLNDIAVKIGMPDEAATAFSAVQALAKNETVSNLLDATDSSIPDENTFIELFNSSAEDAAPESVDIFKTAITGMTINDAENILFGEDNAATSYLMSNTYTGLQDAFHDPITNSLNSVKVAGYTTTTAWKTFATYNNKLADVLGNSSSGTKAVNSEVIKLAIKTALTAAQATGAIDSKAANAINSIQAVNTDLSDYITGKALDGLFTKVADQEYQIRTNVNARVNDVLKKVFGRLDTKNSD